MKKYIQALVACLLLLLVLGSAIPAVVPVFAAPTATGKIAFRSQTADGFSEIFIMNADGSSRTQLTHDSMNDREPCLSLDGSKIVYSSDVRNGNFEIWKINSDGTGQTRLTDSSSYSYGLGDGRPSWSTDGTKIVFESSRNVWNQLYIMNTDGSGLTQVNLPESRDYQWPSFSPDGTKLLFYSQWDNKISTGNLDGSGVNPFTTSGNPYHPAWSPNGSKIAFYKSWPYPIYTMNADGSNQTNIGNGADPTWSPDSNFIAYISGGISIMDAAGTNPVSISGNVYDQEPSWGAGSVVPPAPSNNANLSNLTISAGTLTPAFDSGITSYTDSVAYSLTSITVTPTASESHATIKVNDVSVTSGTPSGAISLNAGANNINILITAQDGTTTRTYTVTVTRQGSSSDAGLNWLVLSNGTLDPSFTNGTTDYTASVPNIVSSVTVTPTVMEIHATVTVNGLHVTSGQPSQAINLNVGDNTISIVVTAQDSITTKTYTVIVTKIIPSSDAGLNWLVLSDGTLDPSFANGTTDYTASVAYNVSSVTVTPTVNEHYATMTVNEHPVTSGQPSQAISLNTGANTITVLVTAQDGISIQTYTVTVTRQPSVIPLVIDENITVSDTPILSPSISLVISEIITVSDTPILNSGISLVIDENISVSDAPILTPTAQTTYTLTTVVNGHGDTNPAVGSHIYTAGIVVPISATPATGWRFLNWTGDVANPNSPSTNVIMNANKTVIANFSAVVLRATIHSPGELRVYDSQNRVTGLVNGEVKEEIPGSSYNTANSTVVIYPATDNYSYQVNGTGTGVYGLEITYSFVEQLITFNATEIPILSGAIHRYSIDWDALAQGQPGVTLQVDLNGDGTFEQTLTSDNQLTADEFWPYVFEDPARGTKLRVDDTNKTFQFITPDKVFPVKNATKMKVINLTKESCVQYDNQNKKWKLDEKNLDIDKDIKLWLKHYQYYNKPEKIILINYQDRELKLNAIIVDGKENSCIVTAKDLKTKKVYWLIDRPKINSPQFPKWNWTRNNKQ